MSEALSYYDRERYLNCIGLDSNHSLQYVAKQCVNSDQILLTVNVTNKCLKSWYEFKEQKAFPDVKFIDIANALIGERFGILIRRDCERIENHFRRLASTVKSQFVGISGKKYETFGSKVKKIAIRKGEVRNIAEVEEELKEQKKQNKILQEKNEDLLLDYEDLQEIIDQLWKEINEARELQRKAEERVEEMYDDLKLVKEENAHLSQYVEKLEELEKLENTGKKFTEVQEKQQQRKLRELKTKAERALWFAETFGLRLSSMEFLDDNGKTHNINYHEQGPKSFKELPKEDQDKIKEIVYLTDKFCIGEAAYHELTLACGGESLPRSYLLRQSKNQLNELIHIRRTPGTAEGAQLDFESELQNTIRKLVSISAKCSVNQCQSFNWYAWYDNNK